MLQTRIKNRLIRRGIVALALLATLPGIPVAAGQAFDEAVAAYGRGDYATAVRGFLVRQMLANHCSVPRGTSGSAPISFVNSITALYSSPSSRRTL